MAHRTDGANNVANMFDDGGAGVPGTTVEEAWLNMVQEELCNLIEACGITLVKGTNTQLLAAAVAAAAANKIVRRDAAGRAAFADPSAAGDADTKGARDAAIAAKFPAVTWASFNVNTTNWTAGTGENVPGYRRNADGTVQFRGTITATATPGSQITFPSGFLPAGYQPKAERSCVVADSTNGARAVVIETTGEISLAAAPPVAGVVVNLSALFWVAEQ
jgi:hypothetical protein